MLAWRRPWQALPCPRVSAGDGGARHGGESRGKRREGRWTPERKVGRSSSRGWKDFEGHARMIQGDDFERAPGNEELKEQTGE